VQLENLRYQGSCTVPEWMLHWQPSARILLQTMALPPQENLSSVSHPCSASQFLVIKEKGKLFFALFARCSGMYAFTTAAQHSVNARDCHSNSINRGLMCLLLNEVFSAKQKETLHLEDEGD